MKNITFPLYKSGNTITSNAQQAFTLYERKRFGEKKGKDIHYMPEEATLLIETKKAHLMRQSKIILSKAGRQNYVVYKDLRKKGYVPKSGLKFGATFRAYKNRESHARWIVISKSQSQTIKPEELAAAARVAHSVAKKVLLALVDSQGDVFYLEITFTKP